MSSALLSGGNASLALVRKAVNTILAGSDESHNRLCGVSPNENPQRLGWGSWRLPLLADMPSSRLPDGQSTGRGIRVFPQRRLALGCSHCGSARTLAYALYNNKKPSAGQAEGLRP